MIYKSTQFLTCLIFLLFPIYYLHSGNIQPIDIAIVSLFFLFALSRNIIGYNIIRLSSTFYVLMILCIYSILALTANYLFIGNNQTAPLILQNIYFPIITIASISLLCYFYKHSTKQEFYEKILWFLFLATVIPLLYMIIQNNIYLKRGCLSFNNPNQLAIYAMLNMAVLFYLNLFARTNNLKMNKWLSLILINIYMEFFIISASRAAFGIVLMYILAYFVIFQVKQIRENPVFSSMIIAALLALPCWVILGHLLMQIESVRNYSEFSLNSIQADSYERAFIGISYNFSHLYYFLFGYGDNSNPLRPENLEFHNNLVGVFNEVGVVGFMLYVLLNICIILSLLKQGVLYLIPYLCYLEVSFFHYIFRERVNWWFLSVIIFITIYQKIDAAKENATGGFKGYQRLPQMANRSIGVNGV